MAFGRERAIRGETVNIEGFAFEPDLISSLCAADGYHASVTLSDPRVERALNERGLIKKLVRGGVFGTDKLRGQWLCRQQALKALADEWRSRARAATPGGRASRSDKGLNRRLALLLGMRAERLASVDFAWYVLRDAQGTALGTGGSSEEDAWLDCPRFSHDYEAALDVRRRVALLGWQSGVDVYAEDGVVTCTVWFAKELPGVGMCRPTVACTDLAKVPMTVASVACQALEAEHSA